jgi:cellulose synthase/poly-beta-1,6-N-acetylglucosamine synthase-like glycosyltransferase
VVHNQSLPEGWLGKVHALHLGTQAVNGEWVLFTDADVHFAPGCLQRAITLAEDQELDYIAAFPQMLPRTFWLQTVIGTFGLIFLVGTRSNRVNDPRVDSYVGVGAFNLVKRSAFDRTPGFEWLRLEIADDVGLGMMLKRAGARGALVHGLGCLAVEWYSTLGHLVRGLEKNAFSVAGYSWPRLIGMISVLMVVFLAPFLLLLPPVEPWELSLVVLQLGTLIILGEKLRQWVGLWWVSTFFLHFALPIICWAALRSGYKVTQAGGVTWRGSFYGLEELRGGRRLEP